MRSNTRVGRTSTPIRPTSTQTVRSTPATRWAGDASRRRSGRRRRGASGGGGSAECWYHRAVTTSRLVARLALVLALWYATAVAAFAAPPAMHARAYMLLNPDTGEILASRNPDMRLPMASTTKMMTALTVITATGGNGVAVVPADAVATGESSAGLVAGEQIGVRDLLKGLLVGSGNDAAVTLADHVAGSQPGFVRMMNARARRMGLTGTRFANPHGLDAPGHHSTVRDLIRMARAVMADPVLRPMVAHRTGTIPGPGGVGTRLLEGENDLLDIDREADGVKTGHTNGAGYALAAHARRPRLGVQLYAAVIGAPSRDVRAREMRALLDWGFAQYGTAVVLDPSRTVADVPMADRDGVTVPVRAGGPAVRRALRIGAPLDVAIALPGRVGGDVARGEALGTVTVRQNGRVLATRPLVAAADVAGAGVVERVRSTLESLLP